MMEGLAGQPSHLCKRPAGALESGLLVRDPALAATVVTHFRTLIERGLLKSLPAA